MSNPAKSKATGRFGLSIDPLPGGVQLFIKNGSEDFVVVGLPKRQARAFANRILHELDFQDGRRERRPSTPHLFGDDLMAWTKGESEA
jgi:hypothetical protein